ncbi:putative disease resistance protein RGA1 [Ziziphus jujuba]|uniref:Disease resistance protein RGA1 n=1 Tax=Ziziphus jujuba TaxID=326968 RepID=A0A6P3YS34_ZIZJJ|nr:putative disease resistance protein RGA1 [Ziziphus jujuba]
MWVCVSDVFYVKLLVRKITESACNRSLANIEMETLQKKVRKRYLLVLDDTWNENREKLFNLKNLLTDGAAEGSRIVVTTRSKKVTGGAIQPHELGVLDENKSWSLFEKMAFEGGKEPTNNCFVEIGMKIVKKCGGIPLALKTIGSLLYCKNPETESFFQEAETDEMGNIRKCKMHDHMHDLAKLQGLPSDIGKLVNLKHLEIDGCESLAYLPCGLRQLTNLQKLTDFPLTRGKATGGESSSVTSSSSPRAKLKALHSAGIEELESQSNLDSFSSLKCKKVEKCPNLKLLSPGIQHLALLITSCPKVEYVFNEDAAICTTLQKLQILQCDSLIAITEWICNLRYLKELEIQGCPNLTSVP